MGLKFLGPQRADAVEHSCARTAALRGGERGERFTHVTWSDGMVLVAERTGHVQAMAMELAAALEQHIWPFSVRRSTSGHDTAPTPF